MERIPGLLRCGGKGCPLKNFCLRYLNPHREPPMRMMEYVAILSPPYKEELGTCKEILDTRILP